MCGRSQHRRAQRRGAQQAAGAVSVLLPPDIFLPNPFSSVFYCFPQSIGPSQWSESPPACAAVRNIAVRNDEELSKLLGPSPSPSALFPALFQFRHYS